MVKAEHVMHVWMHQDWLEAGETGLKGAGEWG